MGRGIEGGGHGGGDEEVWEKVEGRGGGEVGDRRGKDRDRLPCHPKTSSRVKNRAMSAPRWMKPGWIRRGGNLSSLESLGAGWKVQGRVFGLQV